MRSDMPVAFPIYGRTKRHFRERTSTGETVRIACQVFSDTRTESDDEDKLADAGTTHRRAAMSSRRAGGYSILASTQEFKEGDNVTWRSHRNTAEGTVEEKITSDETAAKRKVRASEDDPQYRVRNDKSGSDAVHNPAALKKQSEK
jgi:hypothetical protein